MTRTDRERELLAVTLRLLREHGYDRLTVDQVAAEARASKATIYRSWPTKAELVLAAFSEGVRQVTEPPDTGAMRGDLIALGEMVSKQAREHAATVRAVLVEVSRNPKLNNALQTQLFDKRKALVDRILEKAVQRGEIDAAAINHELWDLLPGYMIYRSVIQGRLPTSKTVRALVDDIVIPSLTRNIQF